jgi:eukaryotic-like serine/threonine-protein kinase
VLNRICEKCGFRYDAATEICPEDESTLVDAQEGDAGLGAYLLEARIGHGGMGAVYRAVHRKLGRVAAIKLLDRRLRHDAGVVNRFLYEARAANVIRHPHVIQIYDLDDAGDDVYFVMEYLEGYDLQGLIHRSVAPLDPDLTISILSEICLGLQATHDHRIVHRDLKPENVFLARVEERTNFVKILDFGVAKIHRPDGRATIQGSVLGTPQYMAPEQARGLTVDSRADIYSLGCIAYEMFAGHPPLSGDSQDEILGRQMAEDPLPLDAVAAHVPAAVSAVVMSALAKDPERRPPTAMAFAERLTRASMRGPAEHASSVDDHTPLAIPISVIAPARPSFPISKVAKVIAAGLGLAVVASVGSQVPPAHHPGEPAAVKAVAAHVAPGTESPATPVGSVDAEPSEAPPSLPPVRGADVVAAEPESARPPRAPKRRPKIRRARDKIGLSMTINPFARQ